MPILVVTYNRPAVSHRSPSDHAFSSASRTCNQPYFCLLVSLPSGCIWYIQTQCEADSVTYNWVWSGERVRPLANFKPSSTTSFTPPGRIRYNLLGLSIPSGEVTYTFPLYATTISFPEMLSAIIASRPAASYAITCLV